MWIGLLKPCMLCSLRSPSIFKFPTKASKLFQMHPIMASRLRQFMPLRLTNIFTPILKSSNLRAVVMLVQFSTITVVLDLIRPLTPQYLTSMLNIQVNCKSGMLFRPTVEFSSNICKEMACRCNVTRLFQCVQHYRWR